MGSVTPLNKGGSSEGAEVLHTKPQQQKHVLAAHVADREGTWKLCHICPLSHPDCFLHRFSKNDSQLRRIGIYISQTVKSAPKRVIVTFRRVCYKLNFRAKTRI